MSELKEAITYFEQLLHRFEDAPNETYWGKEHNATTRKMIHVALDAMRRAQPENGALTLSELRQMDGEPVYIVTLDNPLENQPYWAIVGITENDSRYPNGVALYNKVQGDWGSVELYGKTWLAYRAKPERSEGE